MCCHIKHLTGPSARVWSHRMPRRRRHHHHHDPSQNRTSTIDPIPPARLFLPTHRPRGTGREIGTVWVRYGFLGDTHHQPLSRPRPRPRPPTRTHCLSRELLPMPAVSCPTLLPCSIPPYHPLDSAVLRRIGYTCLACPVPAMLVDVGPTPPCGRCLLPSTWYVALPGGSWRQSLLQAPGGASCARGEGQGVEVAPEGLYFQLHRALVRREIERNDGGGPGRPCGSGTMHPVSVQTLSLCLCVGGLVT